jgi:predicted amidohydrolase
MAVPGRVNILSMSNRFLHQVEEGQKLFNSHIIINNSGEIVNVYDKIHLFTLNYDSDNTMNESNTVEYGSFNFSLNYRLVYA